MPIDSVVADTRIAASWGNAVTNAVNGLNDFTLVTSGAVDATDWQVDGLVGYVSARMLMLRLTFTRLNSAVTINASGNIGNQSIATLPTSLRGDIAYALPAYSGHIGRVATGYYTPSTGVVTLAAIGGTSDIAVSEQLTLGGFWLIQA